MSRRGAGEFDAMPATPDGPRVVWGYEQTAREVSQREAARRELLAEIDAWLLDQALADDADGAEWDADFYRVVRARLAEHFKP